MIDKLTALITAVFGLVVASCMELGNPYNLSGNFWCTEQYYCNGWVCSFCDGYYRYLYPLDRFCIQQWQMKAKEKIDTKKEEE